MFLLYVSLICLTGVLSAPPSSSKHNQDLLSYVSSDEPFVEMEFRNKRDANPEVHPYSAYQGRTSMNRYRYPLYKKRAVPNSESYSYDEDYYDDSEVPQSFSLFRERPQETYKRKSQYNNIGMKPYDLSSISKPQMDEEQHFNKPPKHVNINHGNSGMHSAYSDGHQYEQLRNLLQYVAANNNLDPYSTPIIRRKKRDTSHSEQNKTHNMNKKPIRQTNQIYPNVQKASPIERSKRAFDNYLPWNEKHTVGDQSNSWDQKHTVEDQSNSNQEDFDDFLAREYFKTIARSVGNKKKRTTFGKLEANKRSNLIDQMLDNPAMLQYMLDELKDAEKTLSSEAQVHLTTKDQDKHVNNHVAIREAVKQMIDAITEVQQIKQHGDAKRTVMPSLPKSMHPKTKRKAVMDDAVVPYFAEALKEPAECPVMEHLMESCGRVSEMVGDKEQLFMTSCLRHEICYMCGAGIDVTGHVCDALLSSALDRTCTGSTRDCLRAAGETFSLLSQASRYDHEGSCTYDPCVRQLFQRQ